MKTAILFFTAILISYSAFTQELNCNVTINSDQIQITNKQVFVSMEKSISDFLNNRRWTDMSVLPHERITCNVTIIIRRMDNEHFDADINVQSVRPVFKSSYTTPLVNLRDPYFSFTYAEYAPLEFNDMTFVSNLTAVLAYYAYLIIGYDADSFSRFGGTSWFRKAENITSMAQSTMETGWKAFDKSQIRYSLISALTNDSYRKYRDFFYEYHRLGLDEMSNSVEKGRDKIASNFSVLRDINRQYPSNYLLIAFLEAKNDELVNIFSKAGEKQRTDVYNVLMDINPTLSDKYQVILKGK